MSRDELRRASEALQRAATDVSDEQRERVETQADQLASLADRDQGPDHGRLARHMLTIQELAEQTGHDDVQTAYDHVKTYREGIEGV